MIDYNRCIVDPRIAQREADKRSDTLKEMARHLLELHRAAPTPQTLDDLSRYCVKDMSVPKPTWVRE